MWGAPHTWGALRGGVTATPCPELTCLSPSPQVAGLRGLRGRPQPAHLRLPGLGGLQHARRLLPHLLQRQGAPVQGAATQDPLSCRSAALTETSVKLYLGSQPAAPDPKHARLRLFIMSRPLENVFMSLSQKPHGRCVFLGGTQPAAPSWPASAHSSLLPRPPSRASPARRAAGGGGQLGQPTPFRGQRREPCERAVGDPREASGGLHPRHPSCALLCPRRDFPRTGCRQKPP